VEGRVLACGLPPALLVQYLPAIRGFSCPRCRSPSRGSGNDKVTSCTPTKFKVAHYRPVSSVDQRRQHRGYCRIPAMIRSVKFCRALLINLAVAVISTAIVDTAVRGVIPTHTVTAMVCNEIILSVICATFVGFFMWRTWRSSAAKWIWVLAALWFVFGYLTIANKSNVFERLSGFTSGSVLSAPDVRTFFAFTVPLIRATFYSTGAYISSILYHARITLPDGC